MIFRITEKPFFEDNPSALGIFPESSPDKMMKFLVLYHDPDSVYRRVYSDEMDRRWRICESRFIGWTKNTYKNSKARYSRWWEPQEKRLLALIKDSDFEVKALESLNVEINRQLDLVGKKSKTGSEKEEVVKILKDLKNVLQHQRELQERYDKKYGYMLEEEIVEEEAEEEKSHLEKFLGS